MTGFFNTLKAKQGYHELTPKRAIEVRLLYEVPGAIQKFVLFCCSNILILSKSDRLGKHVSY